MGAASGYADAENNPDLDGSRDQGPGITALARSSPPPENLGSFNTWCSVDPSQRVGL